MDVIAAALAVFLGVTGVAHFVFPGYFRSLVPSWLGPAGLLVVVSGVAEVVVGVFIAVPATRAAGAWAASALIGAYLLSHLDAVRHARPRHTSVLLRPGTVAARLVVNAGYIGWAVYVATGA
ncbi:hypothetical protein AB0K18_08900 [Nonomuraea sp. NPDC049421]|uniref:hypothetical protein n=1 Tax=Nonomuraea sp. NPDC049421 TaxID=3155275 RepID=UPI00343AA098